MTTPFGRSLLLDDGDLVMAEGRLREVESVANLSQALTLAVLTPAGSDPFNTGYGLDLTQAYTRPNPLPVVKQLIQLNLVSTLGADPRIREIRRVIFDDDPALPPADEAHHRRVWTVTVELETIAGDPLTLLVDVGV